MKALGIDESSMRNAGAWVAEKFGRGKLGFGGGETSGLPLLQALETLAIGITGTPPLGGTQGGSANGVSSPANRLRSLALRAQKQIEQVEAKRLAAAMETFPAM